MSQKVKAIVVRSEDKKDKDASVLLFSIEEGKFWATVRGVKSPNSKLRSAKEVFSFGEFLLEEGKGGKIVTNFDRIENFHEITSDIGKFYEGCAILETVSRLEFSSKAEWQQVFVLVLKCLKVLCFRNIRKNYVLCKFMLSVFDIYGFGLYSDRCTCCKNRTFEHLFLDYTVGQLVCVSCKSPVSDELSRVTYSAMKLLSVTDFDRLESLKLAGGSEFSLLKTLAKNFEARFDCSLNFVGILS